MARAKLASTASEFLPSTGLQISSTDAAQIIPAATFTSLPWWDKLNDDEKGIVQEEGQALAQAMLVNGASRLAVGEHLTRLQGVLEPHNLFGRLLKNFHFSKRSAYRFIAGYKHAKERLPEQVVKAAMARGINLLGENDTKPLGAYTEAVKRLPPPTAPDLIQANTWLDQVEQVRKEARQQNLDAKGTDDFVMPEPLDPATAMKECYLFVSKRYKQLPNNSKARANWMRGLVGMLITELGVSGPQTFTPTAIPEDFRRGRPAKKVEVSVQ